MKPLQVLALRRIIEGVKRKHLPAVMTFIDFKKAFDSIHRGNLMKIVRAYRIPARIVQSISNVYSRRCPAGRHPCPYLFIIVLDYALRRAITGKEEQLGFTITPGKSRRVRPVIQTDFDFADDIALVSDSVEKAQALLLSVEGECQKMGLQLNAKKTEVMTFNINENVRQYINLLCFDHFGRVVSKVMSVGWLYLHLAKPSRLFVIATLTSRHASNIASGDLYTKCVHNADREMLGIIGEKRMSCCNLFGK